MFYSKIALVAFRPSGECTRFSRRRPANRINGALLFHDVLHHDDSGRLNRPHRREYTGKLPGNVAHLAKAPRPLLACCFVDHPRRQFIRCGGVCLFSGDQFRRRLRERRVGREKTAVAADSVRSGTGATGCGAQRRRPHRRRRRRGCFSTHEHPHPRLLEVVTVPVTAVLLHAVHHSFRIGHLSASPTASQFHTAEWSGRQRWKSYWAKAGSVLGGGPSHLFPRN